jgi:hypothetical protein
MRIHIQKSITIAMSRYEEGGKHVSIDILLNIYKSMYLLVHKDLGSVQADLKKC